MKEMGDAALGRGRDFWRYGGRKGLRNGGDDGVEEVAMQRRDRGW